MHQSTRFHCSLFLAVLFCGGTAWGNYLQVTGMSPTRHRISAPVDSRIRIDFDLPLDPTTINPNALRIFGESSGPVTGSWQLDNGNRTAYIQPARPFAAGELITVMLSNGIAASNGDMLRPGGFAYQFWTATRSQNPFALEYAGFMSTGVGTIPYGGVANDLNQDGWLDVGLVNETPGDFRVFLNRADGSGTFADYLRPTTPLRSGASANKPQDFNGDGQVDIAVGNYDGTLSILLGNGDGTFAPQQVVPAPGSGVRSGITALDVEGDGDIDIVKTPAGGAGAASASGLYLFLNDGLGTFGSAMSIGNTGAQGLAAGDMNNDGLLDLVSRDGPVYLANGNGTFSVVAGPSFDNYSFQIALGDLNGDGNLDVTTPNRLYLGNGDGTLTQVADPASSWSATDLGDLDGDGDLDWIVSTYGNRQQIFMNNGMAVFTDIHWNIDPHGNNECALLMDFDNDGDLDITSFSETQAKMKFFRNLSVVPEPLYGCSWVFICFLAMGIFARRGLLSH